MMIDPTIYAAIDSGELTREQVLEGFRQAWAEAEGPFLEQVAAEYIAHGCNEADVRRAIEIQGRKQAAQIASGALETLRQMLDANATRQQ